jgi:phospholipase/carboxylesterase
MGYPTEFRTYPMDHSVCLEEIRDLDEFIARCLGAGVS